MTREEAINKVRQMSLPKETMEILEALAPELKESEDERIRKGLEILVQNAVYPGLITEQESKNYLAYLEKQKSAEWSEEDEAAYNAFICEVVNEKMNPTTEQVKWLRSIRDRLKYLHPIKQEWSEEDENMRNLAIEWAETMSGRFSFVGMDSTDFHKIISWLKSIRPQYHGDVTMTEAYKMGKEAGEASHWKPSEEQMNTLAIVIDEYYHACTKGSDDKSKTLKTLFEQLKKL